MMPEPVGSSPVADNAVRSVVLDMVGSHAEADAPKPSLDRHLQAEMGIAGDTLDALLSSLRKAFALSDDALRADPVTVADLVATVAREIAGRPRAASAALSERAARVLGVVRVHTQHVELERRLDADLEGELGIDSVVLSSIMADLRSDVGAPREERQKRIPRTLRELIEMTSPGAGSGEKAGPPRASSFAGLPAVPSSGDPPDVARSAASGPQLEIRKFVAEQIGMAVAPSAALTAQGVAPAAVCALHRDLAERLQLPETLRLDACDTVEKLERYAAAARLHASVAIGVRGAEAADDSPADGRSMKDFVEVRSKNLFEKAAQFRSYLAAQEKRHLFWYGMPFETPCKNRGVIFDALTGRRREFLIFASNNYLGLANHPRVIEAICEATKRFGATNTGCRLIGGTNQLHKELEVRLARFKKREACIVYPSGYSANLGCISALVRSRDAVIVDKLNHMSIVDGCRLSGGRRHIHKHNDMGDLERLLEQATREADGVLVATDGVFSMHGDVCRLPEIVALARRYGGRVLVDDAHSTGVLGARGSGTAEHFHLEDGVDLELGTLSKALAGQGGFVAADAEVVDYLRFYSNSYVFAANIPAGVAAGLIASIDVLEKEPERLATLWSNIRYLREHLEGAGFDLGASESAILPLVIGDERRTLEMGRAVRARGLFCQTVVYPGVSLGDARLRVSVTSEHTREDLDLAAQIFVDAARETGVIPCAAR